MLKKHIRFPFDTSCSMSGWLMVWIFKAINGPAQTVVSGHKRAVKLGWPSEAQ